MDYLLFCCDMNYTRNGWRNCRRVEAISCLTAFANKGPMFLTLPVILNIDIFQWSSLLDLILWADAEK